MMDSNTYRYPKERAPADIVQAVLEEHRHKPSRVQARLVVEALTIHRTPEPTPAPPVLSDKQDPDPQAWVEFRQRLIDDPFGALVDQGVATTRNRTYNAMRALGLDPSEVRAVVVERDFVRIYWFDRGRPSVPQTVPILEESA